MKTIALTVSAIAMAVAAAPSAEASFKHGAKHKKHHGHYHYREYRIHSHYAPRHRRGHRPDCWEFERRAYLTANAYWHYAANSCLRDHYKKAY